MTSAETPARRRPPAGLQVRGKAFWRATMADYDFSTAETAILEEACRCLDRLDLLADTITALGAMVTGSQGQPVVNPALTEARGQQLVLHRLVAALQLPDAAGDAVPTGRSLAAMTAADARWTAAKRKAG